MKRRRSCLLVAVIFIALGLAVVAFLLSPFNFLRGPTQTQLAISAPAQGAAVALHGTLPVVAEANSAVGVRRLELWVNSQMWAAADFSEPQREVRQMWPWTPSGEGTHLLLLRSVDAYGWTAEAEVVTVYASAGFDVLFPLPYTASGGETLAGLAAELGSDAQAIAGSNPGLDPNAPLNPGQQLTIPVPIPNTDPAAPAGGQPPQPPVASLPESPGAPPGGGQSGGPDSGPGATGGIILKQPVQQIYAYVSLAGGPWFRVPDGIFTFLPSAGSTFDVKPHLKPEMLAGLQSPVAFYAQLWGWAGGQLVYLGDQSGTLSFAFPEARAQTDSKLAIIGRIRDSVSYESEWTIPRPIPDYFQGYKQGFQWSVSVKGITGGIWQASTQPFEPGSTWLVPGFVDSGKLAAPKNVLSQLEPLGIPIGPVESEIKPVQFEIDFAKYLDLPASKSPIQLILEAAQGALNQASGLKRWEGSLPTTFYVRVLPIMASKLGEPSNAVVVHYGPAIPEPVTGQTGPIYDVQLLSLTSFRAADPAYKACMVLQTDILYCHSTYSLDPAALDKENLHIQNILKNAAKNGWLETYKSQYPGVVIESKKCYTQIPKGALSCSCPGVSCSSGSSCSINPMDWGSCAEWGFNQLKSISGWISEKYEELKELAVDFMMKYTLLGLQCKLAESAAQGVADDELPPDLCRKAFKVAVEAGLAAMGVPPTIPNFDQLMSEGKDYLIEMAVKELEDQGIVCDVTCEGAIKAGFDKLTDSASGLGSGSDSGTGASGYPLFWKAHPLAQDQPASMSVRVTRRPETAAIPLKETGVCSLLVWNGSTNTIYGPKLEGAPFIGVAMDIPPMQPGESMTIPVVLQRMAWNPPKGLTLQTASGQSFQPTPDPAYGLWSLLYYGSNITFDLRGPVFSTTGSDGKKVSVSCMNNFKTEQHIPVP